MEKMINQIGRKAAISYRNAAKATRKITKEVKLKTEMADKKARIQALYKDIGKSVYEKYLLKEEIKIETDLLNNCSMIDFLASEVEDLRMEILELKGLKQCPNCHYEIYYDFNYCPNCGNTQMSEQEDKSSGSVTIETTDDNDKILKQKEGKAVKNETSSTKSKGSKSSS